MLVEEGRLCIKRLGRDAGQRAVIIKTIDSNFVSIMTHSRPKERRCNISHLEFLSEKVNPKNSEEVYAALELDQKQVEKLGARRLKRSPDSTEKSGVV